MCVRMYVCFRRKWTKMEGMPLIIFTELKNLLKWKQRKP